METRLCVRGLTVAAAATCTCGANARGVARPPGGASWVLAANGMERRRAALRHPWNTPWNTHPWNIHGRSIHPWNIHGESMQCPWNIHGTPMEHQSVEHPWNIQETAIEHPWNILHPWNIHRTCTEHPWDFNGTSPEHP
eukprot:gene15853-biopygen14290